MKSPEAIGLHEAQTLETSLSDVTVRDINAANLPTLKKMFEDNAQHFGQGGIFASGLYDMIESETTTDEPSPNHRMGIWKNDTLVGFVSVVPSEEPRHAQEVEVAYGIDPAYARKGITQAAVDAVVQRERNQGNTVIAEVERYNHASIKLLGKIGFELTHLSDGRKVYTNEVLTVEEIMRRLGM